MVATLAAILGGDAQRSSPLSQGREVDALRRLGQIAGVRTPIRLLFSQDSVEPGIFGIVRPALVWPAGISQHPAPAHLEAIVAHEVWHVRRRENLAAAIHMVVEAFFWFHPLVWWLGTRLVEERERACDEEVLKLGLSTAGLRREHSEDLRILRGIAAGLYLRSHRCRSQGPDRSES